MRRLRYSVPYIAGKSLPKDSDPAPRGAGPLIPRPVLDTVTFQSTRPVRGGPRPKRRTPWLSEFQSTRPLRGGTQVPVMVKKQGQISIHPPLAGRDSDLAQKNCAKHRILHKKCIYPGRIERFSGFDAAIFLPNVHKFRCEPSEESLLAPRSHAYTIRTPSC